MAKWFMVLGEQNEEVRERLEGLATELRGARSELWDVGGLALDGERLQAWLVDLNLELEEIRLAPCTEAKESGIDLSLIENGQGPIICLVQLRAHQLLLDDFQMPVRTEPSLDYWLGEAPDRTINISFEKFRRFDAGCGDGANSVAGFRGRTRGVAKPC